MMGLGLGFGLYEQGLQVQKRDVGRIVRSEDNRFEKVFLFQPRDALKLSRNIEEAESSQHHQVQRCL